MTPPLLSLFGHATRSAVDREAKARRALSLVDRALSGEGAERRVVDEMPVVGTAGRRLSYHHLGPRGGRAVVVRVMGMEIDARGSLLLARSALEALLSPRWARADREHAGATATAIALLAHDRRPDAEMCAGFLRGPCGPTRSEHSNTESGGWIGIPIDEGHVVSDTLDGILVDLENPRDHGRTPPAVTLSQVRGTLRREWAMRLDAMERLRYAQLARRA